MVIRGRRVNRCDTCTRRKVKCDERRPECERCKKSGLQCEGYSLKLVLVGPKDGLSSAPDQLAVWRPQIQDTNTTYGVPQNRQLMPLRPKLKHKIRCLLPTEDDVLTTHILSRFSPPNSVESSAPAALLPQLIKMNKSYSGQALAAIYFGKMRNQYQIYQKGTRLYGRALDQLRKAVIDPEKAQQNQTLTSVLCLCLYENIVLSETTAWLKHYQGIGRLVEYRGPNCHRTEFERGVFRICRFMIILAAGVTKSHCFLAEAQWRLAHPRPAYEYQAAIDRLYDIMTDIPGLFHDLDYLEHSDKASESKSYLELRERASRVLCQLYDWPRVMRQSTDLENENYSDEEAEACGPYLALPPRNHAVAAALAIYYASILSLATAADYFDLPLHLPSLSNAASRVDGDDLGADPVHKAYVRKTLACEICHLATATLRGEQSTSTAFFFIFSLQVAHGHLIPDTPEGLRIEGLLDSVIAEKHGFETGRTRKWAALFNSPPKL